MEKPYRIQLNKSNCIWGLVSMGINPNYTLPDEEFRHTGRQTIEERACNLARYIIDSKDTVRGAAKRFRNFKINSTQRRYTKER